MALVIDIITWGAILITLYFSIYWLLYFFENKKKIKKELNQKINLKSHPFFSVIVPVYNEEKTIKKTLESLIKLDYPADKFEIVIVNDASTDKTRTLAEQFVDTHKEYNISLLNHKVNGGKGKALNTGLKTIKGSLFACLDADSFVDKKTMKRMVFWHQKYKNVAIMTPVMKIYKPKTYIQKFQRIEYLVGMLLNKLMSYMDCNYVAPGPFSVYKTRIIKKLGGFDENNLVEDQEIAYRVQKHNYGIKQCPKGYVYTIGPNTLKSFGNQRNRWYKGTIINLVKYRNMMLSRKYGDFGMFQLPLNLATYILAAISIMVFGYFLFKPLFEQLRDLSIIGFDFMPYIHTFSLKFDILGLPFGVLAVTYLALFLSIIFLYFASRTNKSRVRKYGTFYLIPYFFVYFLLISFIMIKVVMELAVGKKRQRW